MIESDFNKIARELQDDVKQALGKASKDVAKEGIKRLKSSSPKRTGEYAKGWGQSRRKSSIVVHNKAKPGLTHLLEKGHALRRGGRKVGEVGPQKHIKPVEEWVKKEMVNRIEKELE